jgi:hypothetical protein
MSAAVPPPPAQPPASPVGTGGYPVAVEFNLPEKVARWRVIGNAILAIPHFFVLLVLGVVAEVLVFIGWILGVFTGTIPESFQGLVATYVRYSTRVSAYYFFLAEDYPPFTFEAAFADPGDYAPLKVDVVPKVEGRNRLTIFFRYFMVIPQFIVLFFVFIALYVVLILGFFAVLFTGKWPAGLRNFATGALRWNARLSAYLYLLTDEYPPFSLS